MGTTDEALDVLMKGHGFHAAVLALCAQTGDTPMGVLHNLAPKEGLVGDANIRITPDEMAFIRRLSDFDLMMFLSDLEGHGWRMARRTLWLIWEQPEYQKPAQKRGAR
jgi:hypothetical protein